MALTGRRARRAATTFRLSQQAGARSALQNAIATARGQGVQMPKRPRITAPPGSYDPMLDAQQRSTERGLGDLRLDHIRDYGEGGAGGRAFNDYTLSVEDITRQVQQGREDFDRQRGGIQLGYTRLGRRQGELARKAGVLSKGIAAMSAAKRGENQARDINVVDTQEDRAFGFDRRVVGGEAGRTLGRLALGYQRQTTDAGTDLERAEREASQFGIDTNAAKLYQAQINGMLPLAPRRAKGRRKGRRR